MINTILFIFSMDKSDGVRCSFKLGGRVSEEEWIKNKNERFRSEKIGSNEFEVVLFMILVWPYLAVVGATIMFWVEA